MVASSSSPLSHFLFQWRHVSVDIQTDNAAGCSGKSSSLLSSSSGIPNKQLLADEQTDTYSYGSTPVGGTVALSSRWESCPAVHTSTSGGTFNTNPTKNHYNHGLTLPRRAPPSPPKNDITAPPRVPQRQVSFEHKSPATNSIQKLHVPVLSSSSLEQTSGASRVGGGGGTITTAPLSPAGLLKICLPFPKVPTARGA